MRGGLFPILCVNWTVKNPIAPEPTYTNHYYYYSTKTTLSKETSVRREGICNSGNLSIFIFSIQDIYPEKEFQLHQAGHEKCQTGCHPK